MIAYSLHWLHEIIQLFSTKDDLSRRVTQQRSRMTGNSGKKLKKRGFIYTLCWHSKWLCIVHHNRDWILQTKPPLLSRQQPGKPWEWEVI